MDNVDTILPFLGKLDTREIALENGQIHCITKYTRGLGIAYKASVTNGLFRVISPWGEDAVKGISYELRIEDLVSDYKRAAKFAKGFFSEFQFKYNSYIDESLDVTRISCYKDGKSRDKTVGVYGALMPVKDEEPSLLFGLLDS